MKNVSIMAKSSNFLEGISKQKLTEHISDLLEIYDKIKTEANFENIMPGFSDYLKFLCILHDLGKINVKFQKKIEIANIIDEEKSKDPENSKDNPEVRTLWNMYNSIKDERHNLLSGAFLKYFFDNISIQDDLKSVLYKSVFYHHGSYERYLGKSFAAIEKSVFEDIEKGVLLSDEFDKAELEEYLSGKLGFDVQLKDNIMDYGFLKYLNENFEENNDKRKLYILLKGFLNLIDHLASSQEKNIEYYLPITSEEMDNLIISFLCSKLERSGKKVDKIEFNQLQKRMKDLKNRNVVTIAFTGAGKTIADYRWFGKRKIFLVPNKISGESFYFDAVEIFGSEDFVGLLHGDISLYVERFRRSIKGEDIFFTSRDKTLAKNFAKPYIISTVDQILLAIFKYPGYEKIFASIYKSYITVDEVHLLTPRMFLTLMYFIEFTAKHMNAKFHLMTATMPRIYLEKLNSVPVTFEKSNENEVIEENKKIKLMFCKEKDWVKMVSLSLESGKKVLIVKNTIDEAIKAYEQLRPLREKGFEINVLHSRFKFKHKRDKYKKILDQQGDVWIATQMVEISLDLDFEVIISDLAPMDAIIQRMGRCNRHDRREYGEFYIIDQGKDDVYEEKLKKATKKFLRQYKDKILSMRDRKQMLENYYNDETVEKFYYDEFKEAEEEIKEIYGLINKSELNGENIMFKFDPYLNIVDSKIEASKLFRKIEQNAKVLLEEDYYNAKDKPNKFKEYNMCSIQIGKGMFFKLQKFNAFYIEDGFLIIKQGFCQYDRDVGLRLNSKQKLEDISIEDRIV